MTPTLMLFFTLCVLLCVLLAWVVIFPWLKGRAVVDNRLMSVNVAVFRERIAELDEDKAAGVIDEQSYQAQTASLKRQLLAAQTHAETHQVVGRVPRLIVIVWILLLAALAYLLVGDRTSVYKLWQAQANVGQVADDLLTGKIDTPPEWAAKDSAALITAMQTNVYAHAYDANRWMRLSELFSALQAQPQMLEALARAHRLEPDNHDIAMTYAQASFFANNGVLDGVARDVVTNVLKAEPNHEGAQMLMVMGETRAGRFEIAKAWLSKLRSSIAAKSGDRSEALASLDTLAANIEEQAKKAVQGVAVSINIAPNLMPQIGETDVLFVSISDTAGGAPYAVKRLPVSQMSGGTATLTLSDLDAMLPERTLSVGRAAGVQLALNARISHSGSAMSESGDLAANPVILGDVQTSANLTISQVVP
ncbi:c-type cytochrome biogenesis protein CcmI [Moraxella caviae]|uniref:C-type cytochrome biogenesis protein CcmI n=1 Tax=Moraxella caviae TaxID=34060 RepID=A0A1T0A661_9GAMM|nr:c-type cytochrome biogenesis protein CcmI [Moraxella caviae]OOR91069.1 c-type cytochrome biogenesis protein CcmI [Moraxella caviae]STZ14237.1 Cytochrome c biogenesis factor [Moraxella caviae]VEW13173.1 Cytochrome c biogenesis factor [Moraxella caviae]